MCANTSRHRAERLREGSDASDIWHAKELLTGARGPRHVRPVDTTYAKFIGRVGALAVSLGVGVAVATTPGVAFATTDDAGAQSESPSKAGESPASAGESAAQEPAAESVAGEEPTDDEGAEEEDASESEEDDDPELEEPAELEPPTPSSPTSNNDNDDAEPVDTELEVEAEQEVSAPQQLSPAVAPDRPADNSYASDAGPAPSAVESAPAVPEPPQPAETGTLGIEVSDPTAEQTAGVLPAAFTAAPPLNSTAVNPVDALLAVPRTLVGMLSGAISTIFSPFLLAGTAVPVQTPLLWTVLAWVRREIVHTFFNRTPEVNVVKVLPDIPGVAIFDLNEKDPNCDPLTTVITDQPEFGTVVKNPDGTFTYTADVEHLLSGVTDSFTVTITDSVGTHLPGVLGHIQNFFHRIAQFVGLAKPDTIQVTVPVTIPGVGANMPPVLVVSPAAAVGVGESVVLSPTVLLTDADSSQLSGATVTITGADPGDQLTFTGSNGITGAYADGVLTLTGNASAAAYRAVLQSVSFSTDATGLLGLRTVTWSVTDDEGASSSPGVTEVVVLGELNAPPTVVSTPVGVVTAGQSTVVSPIIVIVNEPGELLSGATVTITSPGGSDELTFVGSGGITGSYANGVLTLTGDASAAAYQAVLQSVSFSTGAAGLVGVRTIEFSVTDAIGQDSVAPGVTLLTVIGALNAPPSVVATPVGAVTTGGSTVVSPVIVIVNEPGELLSGATVTITSPDGSDELTFVGSGGITGSYADGLLTLTGDASAAAYRAVLQSVSFSTDVAGVRTIEFSVTDAIGQDSVVPGVTLLTVVSGLNGAPTIVATPVGVGSTGQSTVVSPIIVIVNEPGELLSGATVTITVPDGSDELTFVGSGGITGSYSGGVLTLTGDASAAAYQAVLQSVSLSTDVAGVRTIQFSVTDAAGQESVLPGVTLLTVTPTLNGAPTIVATPVGVGSTGQSTVVSPIIVIVNEPSELLSGATVTITVPDGSDELTFVGSGGITGSYANGVLTLTGDASAAAYQTVLQSVSLTTDVAGVRTIQFAVTDAAGQDSLLAGVTLLTVTPALNGAPTIVATPVGVGSTGQSTVVSPIIVIVNEPGELLSGATVTITVPDGSDELTFTGSGGITGSYANGVLTLTGDASAAAYQTVLQSVSLTTDVAGVRTIQFAVTDAAGQDSLLPGVTLLTVTPTLNGAPTIVTTPVGVGSTGQSTVVSPIIVIVNEPSELLSGATVTITVSDGSDELTFTGSGGITGSYSGGVLTLTGDASAAAYQAVLQSVSLSTDVAGVRTIQFAVTDAAGQDSLLPGVTLLTVTPTLNGAPTIVTTPVGVGSTGQSTVVSPIIVIVNEPGELLSGATVTITVPDGSDELTFTGSGGITGSYVNGVLTLTGDASAAAYQAVLQSVALSTDVAGVRTIQFSVTDAAGQDSVLPGVTLLTVTPTLNGPPTIVTTPVGVGSTGQSTTVSPIIVIVNEPGELLSGATVTITVPDGSDELTFVESGGITGSYANGVLTLTGDAAAAAYQAVLQSVSLTTDVAGVRTIQFAVTDAAGQDSLLPGVTLLTVTPALNNAPTIVATPVGVGSTGQSTVVSPIIVIVNEPGELLSGATVTITVPDGSDELTFTGSGGITGSYVNGVLTLTGDASAAAYQAVLQSVALSTDAAGARTIQFSVTDAAGQVSALPGVTLFTVTPALNGAPTIVTTPVGVGSTGQSTTVSPIIVIVNEPGELLSGATVTITSPDGSDELTFAGSGGITGSYLNGVLTLTGDASAAAYQTVLQSVSLSTNVAGVRTIEFAVTDAAGQESVLPGVTLLTVTSTLNGAPTIVATPVGVGSTGQSTTVSPIIVIVNEPSELLSGATVTITMPDGSDELTFIGSGGITGSYVNGVLTLTGDASAAAYQAVLQSVSLSTDAAGVRTIEFAVTDAVGQDSVLPGVTLLTVTPALNGAPTIVTTPVGVGSTGESTVVSPIIVIVNEPGELLSGATVTITSPDGSDELTFTESSGITGLYVNGVLTLTGDASAAAYQAVLQSVSLSTDVAGVRTIEFAVTDAAGQVSALPGVTLFTVTPALNGAPTIVVTAPVGVGSTGQSTVVSPIIVIVNEPGELLSGATVTITMPDGSDELTFTGSGGITGSYLNGVLTLTGDASAAAYQTVLQSVSLSTDIAGVRTIQFAVTDAAGQDSVLPGVTLLTVTPVLNGAPTIVTTPVGVGATGQSTTVSPLIVIVNEPGELLSGATVTITVPDGSDELTFTGSGGITGSYANGVLTLTGDATASAYQAVLQSVALSTDAAGVRTIEFAVTDAAGQESVLPGVTLLTVTPALNGAPTIVTTPVGVGSTGQSTVVSPLIVIVNEPSELLSGATVTITVLDSSDELTFVGSGGITGTYSGGVLTLTGDASAAAYQAVLQAVSLSTDVAGVRTIEFSVTDAAGQASALPGVTLFTVTPALNGAPTIVTTPVGVGSTGQSTVVSPLIVIVNEPSELLSGATVTITVPDGSDELTYTGSGGITGSYVNGVLTLTGDASAAAYQAVLQSVSLSTDAAGVRTIQFSVTDAAGQDSVLPGVTLLTVTPTLNGAPTIVVTTPVGVGSTGQSNVVSPIIVVVNEPSELLSGATVTITAPDGSDELTFTESGGITGSYSGGVLTLTGDASAAAYQAVLQSVSLSTDVAGVRTIQFAVTDAAGQVSALPGVTLFTVTPALNGAPTIVATPVGVGSTGQSTTVSPIIVIVNEPGELLSGATVTITMPDGSDELTFTESGGITGSYVNGVLTLTGDASAAAYQAVLQSVSLSTDVAGVRTIEFAVTDAAGQESVLPGVTLLTVTPTLNVAPTIVTTPVGVGSTGQSTTVSPIIVVVNEPSELLSGATVTITAPDGSDELTFTESGGITGSYSGGVLTLTGDASAAAYQAVLQSVSLSTDVAGVRTIQFAVTDAAGQVSAIPGVTLFTVTPALNGAPTIVATPVGVGSTGQSNVVSPIIVIVNEPGELLSGATVTITVLDGSDELTFVGSGEITGSYSGGVLTLTGDASAAAYQAVLQSVSLSTDIAGVRTIEFSVTDAAGQESALPGVTLFTVTPALNGAPTIVTTPVAVGSTGQSTTVSPVIVIVNEPGELLSGATVTITVPDGSDELTFTGSGGITGSYSGGVLTLTGDASAAAYQTVLQSVSLSTDAAGVRTIEFSVTDAAGQSSVLPGLTTLTVVAVLNAPPTVVATPVGVGTAGQPSTVSPIITIVNDPGEQLSGATVTITNAEGTDELTFTGSNGITGTYSNGVLALTGNASATAYQTVLQSVSFTGDVAGLRTIEFSVTDIGGQPSLLPGVTALTVVGVLNAAPTIVATPVGATAVGQSTTVSPIIVIVNDLGENLTGATVTITNAEGTDELTFTGSNGITGTYADGVLELTGNASAAAYQTVLQSVSFTADTAGVRSIEFQVIDAAGQEAVIAGVTLVTVVGLPSMSPTVVATPVATTTVGQSTTVSPVVTIVNDSGENLSGATVTITVGLDGSDELTFTGAGGITGSYSNGVLTLSGDASATAYQTVLQSVSFSTDIAGVRTISFQVTDVAGQQALLPGSTVVTVLAALNAPPTVLTLPAGVATTGQQTTVSPVVTIVNDPTENLSGATVTITVGLDGSDELTFTGSGGITGSYSNGVLTLSGNATAAAYQTVLQSVSFTTGVAGLRTIEFQVIDAAGQQALLPGVTAVTAVAPVNAVPTVVALPVGVVTAGQSTTVSPIVTIVNDPTENLTGATVTITAGAGGSDVLTFTGSGGITGSYSNGVLTLSGNATAAAYQLVLQSVSFTTTTAGVRIIEFSVTDTAGQSPLLPGLTTLTVVAAINAAPTILATPVAAVTAGQTTTVSPVVTIVNDPGQNLSGATVTIGAGRDAADVLTFTPSGGITGSFADGVLTLSGNASVAAYQTVLQSVQFTTGSGALIGVRTIEFAVTDVQGATTALPGVTALTVSAVNLPPTVLTSIVGNLVYNSGSPAITVDPLITVSDPTSSKLSSVTLAITVGHDTDDVLTYTKPAGSPINGSYNSATGVLTLTGDGTPAQYQEALRAVKFSTPQVLLASTRTFTVFATDNGGLSSLPLLIALVILL